MFYVSDGCWIELYEYWTKVRPSLAFTVDIQRVHQTLVPVSFEMDGL